MAVTIKYNEETNQPEFAVKVSRVFSLEDVVAIVAEHIADNPDAGKGLPQRQSENWPGKPDVKNLIDEAAASNVEPALDIAEVDPDRWNRAERIVANARMV